MLRIEDLAFARGGRTILSAVELSVEHRETRLLIGASGAGKTTLLRLVAGFEIPDRGRIRLNGVLLSEDSRLRVPPHQRGIAMVFQDGAFWPHMPVESHLRFGLDARVPDRRVRDRLVTEMLELVGLADRRGERPGHLSGGERQRLGLARALIQQPRLLLLDEPLAHIDLAAQRPLRTTIQRVLAEREVTTIWVTHRPDGLDSTYRTVSVLAGGRLDDPTPEEVATWLSAPNTTSST